LSIRRIAFSIGLGILFGGDCYATDVVGHVMVGGYGSNVQFSEPITGESTNDDMIAFGRLKLEATEIGKAKDAAVLDIRDHYDLFGAKPEHFVELKEKNNFELRQLAYKRIPSLNRLYFSLGRFSVPEAGLISNDGGEVGYRINSSFRLSAFAGILPVEFVDDLQLENVPNTPTNRAQGGLFTVYEKGSIADFPAIYLTNAIGQTVERNIVGEKFRLFYFQSGNIIINETNRISAYIDYDLQPKSSLRRLTLGYFYLKPSFRNYLTANRTDTKDYELLRDIRFDLEPSPIQSVRDRVNWKISDHWSLGLVAGTSQRTVDKKSKTEVQAGPTIFFSSSSFHINAGTRKNYLSKDSFTSVKFSHYREDWNGGLGYVITKETYDDKTLNVHRGHLDFEFYFSNKLHGGLSYSLLKDEETHIQSFLLTIGYRFGKKSASPTPDEPLSFEET
jgi:hypothetical protein